MDTTTAAAAVPAAGWPVRADGDAPVAHECELDIVGVREIADMLGVAHQTVKTWRLRGTLPEEEASVSGVPVWRRSTITRWSAGRTKNRRAG